MAIALDTAGGSYARSSNSTSSNHTFNNVAGTFLVVGFALNNAANSATTVTYNGVSMTQVVTISGTAERSYLYYLANPATGSNTLTINRSASRVADVGIASYTGVDLASPIDLTNTNANTVGGVSSTITETITPSVADCWMLAWSGLQRASTASTNSTYRSGNTATPGGSLYDSNGTLTNGVAFTMTQNISIDGLATAVAMTIKPSTGGATSQSILLMGVGA